MLSLCSPFVRRTNFKASHRAHADWSGGRCKNQPRLSAPNLVKSCSYVRQSGAGTSLSNAASGPKFWQQRIPASDAPAASHTSSSSGCAWSASQARRIQSAQSGDSRASGQTSSGAADCGVRSALVTVQSGQGREELRELERVPPASVGCRELVRFIESCPDPFVPNGSVPRNEDWHRWFEPTPASKSCWGCI